MINKQKKKELKKQLRLIGFLWSAAHINANFQYNYLEKTVSKMFDWFSLNSCIADVDIKESTCTGRKAKGGGVLKKGEVD